MNTFLQTLTIGFSLLSAFFLIDGLLSLSPRKVVNSISSVGNHTRRAKELIDEIVNAKIGFVFLILSFILQAYRIMKPVTFEDFEINYLGGLIGILLILVIFLFSCNLRRSIIKNFSVIIKKEMKEVALGWDEIEDELDKE